MAFTRALVVSAVVLSAGLFAACQNSGFTADSNNTDGTSAASAVTIGTSQPTVRSDGSDSATITATVVDKNRGALPNIPVTLSASAGQLTASSGVTDTNGTFSTQFSASSDSVSNATASITASVTGLSEAIVPVQITGSNVSVSVTNGSGGTATSLTVGDSATVTVKPTDAAGGAVADTDVTVAISGSGTATLSKTGGKTDSTGSFTATLTATGAGAITVTATAVGATDTQSVNIQANGAAFQISAPTTDPATVALNGTVPVTVDVPATSSTTEVTFVTSLGTWQSSGKNLTKVAVNATTHQATATLQGLAEVGRADLQVYDSADATTADSLSVLVVDTTVDANSTVALQPVTTTLGVSSGSSLFSTDLTARVTNASGGPIAKAAVVFSLSNTTGGGEFVSPAFGLTDSNGEVTTAFTSGTNSSDSQGVRVTATVYLADGTAGQSSYQDIAIVQKGGSVAIGRGTKISSINNNTGYDQPMAILVSTAAGTPAAGQKVTLKAWPLQYSTGTWSASPCSANITGTHNNEDANRNLIKDPGEDTNGDGVLTPPNSAAGTVPIEVTTDANGMATFDLTYLKSSAVWIVAEITATTQVSGTETTGKLNMRLPYLLGEECNLPGSPYGP